MNLLLVFALGLAGASPLGENKECQPHSRPWHVNLHGGMSCSGALVDQWWIVTSYACARQYSSSHATIASLGDHDLTVEEGTEQHIPVDGVIPHSPYRSPLHSLAMVRLARPAHFNKYVQPIPLPSRCPQPWEICSVSGWGSTIPNHSAHDPRLKCITVPIVADQMCTHGMLCAGQGHTDNCLSDDCSVMVCGGELQGLGWYNSGCKDPNSPTVYTRLCLYNQWINTVMDRHSPTTTSGTTTQGRKH